MSNQLIMHYITQLQQQVQQLYQYSHSLENRIQQLESNKQAKTSIEKLEYHFDQLKIERLDGTLHIGMTPEDLQSSEDLSLNPSQGQTPFPSVHQTLVEDADNELPGYVHSLEQQYNYPLEDDFRQTLIQDVKQQLPNRIAYYQQANVPPTDLPQHILEHVKKEWQQGLKNWFSNQQKE
ncbi:spore germination protein GerPC [Gracilibacillus timonensis]|uniref:spore germination protein GerPC n=1 Tax=Gracilibacillus timonensis TaxID=1816696 RepID=UPI000824102D|nr:spore germination protein GerPC [Gracilibacillus timonensis]